MWVEDGVGLKRIIGTMRIWGRERVILTTWKRTPYSRETVDVTFIGIKSEHPATLLRQETRKCC